jgi:peptidoglycan hydrolase CwlO-like protein
MTKNTFTGIMFGLFVILCTFYICSFAVAQESDVTITAIPQSQNVPPDTNGCASNIVKNTDQLVMTIRLLEAKADTNNGRAVALQKELEKATKQIEYLSSAIKDLEKKIADKENIINLANIDKQNIELLIQNKDAQIGIMMNYINKVDSLVKTMRQLMDPQLYNSLESDANQIKNKSSSPPTKVAK